MGERTMMKYFFMYTEKLQTVKCQEGNSGQTDTENDLGEGYLQLWSVK